jgi:hypothetical protein
VLSGDIRRVELYRQYKKGSEPIIADMKREFCKGFKVGQEFRLRVLKEKSNPAWLEVKKLKPKVLTERQLKRIVRKVERELEGS